MKKILFYFFIIILLIPVLQKELKLFQFSELNGAIYETKDIDFTLRKWVSFEYQNNKEQYIKNNIGFRSPFIKSYNQMLYSFFNIANNPGGVVGKDNYLYLESYIYNETGKNYIGNNKVSTISEQLQFLKNYFKKRDINLLIVIAPSKASFYPEYIPDYYHYYPMNNYRAYLNKFDSLNIDYIDLNKYLISIKETTKYPLFSINGLHWTDYGMALGLDSLVKKIEAIRNIDLPEFDWKKPFKLSTMKSKVEFDAENLMNLYIKMPRDSMPYPEYVFHTDSSKTKPKTLVICDSYYWRGYEAKIPHNVFDWGGFWYYFNTAHYTEDGKEFVKPVSSFDLKEKLLDQDVIVLFASQATLHRFPFGFVNKAYPLFMPTDMESLISYYRQEISNNTESMIKVKEKALSNNRSIDEQIDLDAKWMAERH